MDIPILSHLVGGNIFPVVYAQSDAEHRTDNKNVSGDLRQAIWA